MLTEFLGSLIQSGVELWTAAGELRFRAAKGLITPEVRQQLRAQKGSIIALLGPRRYLFLSTAQHRAWMSEQLQPGNPAHNRQALLDFAGAFDGAALERAVTAVGYRHESLRTTFRRLGASPVQVVSEAPALALRQVDLQGLDVRQQPQEIARLALVDTAIPFDLSSGPLLRITVIRTGASGQQVLLSLHQIIVDGWSMELLARELKTLYGDTAAGQASDLAAPALQYADHAHQELAWQRSDAMQRQLAYWRQQLTPLVPVLELPVDHEPRQRTYRGTTREFRLPRRLVEALAGLHQAEEFTPFMILFTALVTLLHRYTGRQDMVIATTVTNRGRPGMKELLGSVANIVMLRVDISGDPSFNKLLRRVRSIALAAYDHQELPLERALEELRPDCQSGVNPLYNVMFIYVDRVTPGLAMLPVHGEWIATLDFLTLALTRDDQGLSGTIYYSAELFDAATIDQLIAHLSALLDSAIKSPDTPIELLPMVSAEEQSMLQAASHPIQPAPAAPPPRPPQTTTGPLSYNQRALWYISRLAPQSPAYNVALFLQARSQPDLPALSAAMQALIDRHPCLRTTYTMAGEPVQVIHEQQPFVLNRVDASGWNQEQLRQRTREAYRRPFDLEHGPVIRVDLFKRDPAAPILLIAIHHIAVDGWSIGLLMDELRQLYIAATSGTAPPPPPRHCYTDFVTWQQQMLASAEGEEHWQYWRQRLAGEPPVLALPTDRPRPAAATHDGASCDFGLSSELTARLRRLGRQHGATPFALLLLAYQVLLSRYSGAAKIWVASPTMGRSYSRFFPIVGCFINPVVLTADFTGNPSFRVLLEATRDTVREAIRHQDYPFSLLVERLGARRNPGGAPLIPVEFIFQEQRPGSVGFNQEIAWGPLRLVPLDLARDQQAGQVDLALEMMEIDNAFAGGFKYSRDLFEPRTIQRLVAHFVTLLTALADNPEQPINQVPLLTPAEQEQILTLRSNRQREHLPARLVHHVIAASAALSPQALALRGAGHELTYCDLDQRANQLANHLAALGVGPETAVGLAVTPSPEMIIGLLAIFKAGGVLTPLDPSYPAERLCFMIADAGIKVLVTDGKPRPFADDPALSTIIDLRRDQELIDRQSRATPEPSLLPEHLAYVLYTSGSTGRPKGVAVAHRSLAVHCQSAANHYRLTPDDRVLQFASLSVDTALEQILPTLAIGATLVLRGQELWSAPEFSSQVVEHGITVADLPPAYLHELLRQPSPELTRLRLIIVGGEAVSPQTVKLWQSSPLRTTRLINAYGPTETTITATTCDLDPAAASSMRVPIGRPLGQATVYILDRHGNPVPQGVIGELHIGGHGLARGYLNRPAATAQSFIPDPFGPAGSRLYRSGDLARHLESGVIEFLGRRDHQVKLRGFRIELGEIEAQLSLCPGVRQCVVTTWHQGQGDHRLVAHVVAADDQLTPQLMQAHLRQRLPSHMVPCSFLLLDRMPLTAAGKPDRRALPAPAAADGDRAIVAPRNPLEQQLARIWADVLDVPEIGVSDSFFEHGGHSLLALRLLARVSEELGRELPLSTLIQGPTIAETAAQLRQPAASASLLVAIQPLGDETPLHLVHPVGGGVLCYRELADALGPPHPLYGLQSPGPSGDQPAASLEAIAASYLAAVHQHQSQGPYCLGGWSFGGVVAYEMAQQLQRAGEKVALLALIESYTPAILERIEAHHEHAHQLAGDEETWLLDLFARDLLGQGSQEPCRSWQDPAVPVARRLQQLADRAGEAGLEPGQVQQLFAVFKANTIAMRAYQPQPSPNHLTLFRGRDRAVEKIIPDPSNGWQDLAAGSLTIFDIPGNHDTILQTEGARALAEKLRHCLAIRTSRNPEQPGGNRHVH